RCPGGCARERAPWHAAPAWRARRMDGSPGRRSPRLGGQPGEELAEVEPPQQLQARAVGEVKMKRRPRDAPRGDRGEVGAGLVVEAGVRPVDPVATPVLF